MYVEKKTPAVEGNQQQQGLEGGLQVHKTSNPIFQNRISNYT